MAWLKNRKEKRDDRKEIRDGQAQARAATRAAYEDRQGTVRCGCGAPMMPGSMGYSCNACAEPGTPRVYIDPNEVRDR